MPLPKRFYQDVTVEAACGFWQVKLDGKTIKTPHRHDVNLPTKALADAVAAEWAAQQETVKPASMPLMGMAAFALDILSAERGRFVEDVMAYADTDLLCYRASYPEELVRRQRAAWQPLLAWMQEEYNVTFAVTEGVQPVEQSPDVPLILAGYVMDMEDWQLSAFYHAVKTSGSFVIALALLEGRINADQAYQAAYLDDLFQQDQWGEDDEAIGSLELAASELVAVERFATLLKSA